jgi:hypothetical protein
MVVRDRLLQTKENMKTRTDLLNHLAGKIDAYRYLEIGVQDPAHNFDKINIPHKVGIDPSPNSISDYGPVYMFTSDEFFEKCAEDLGYHDNKFHLIFIDGLHTAEQVMKDFENALKILSPGGFIVLHDCNPEKEEHTIVPRPTERGHWNGDVYKFACILKSQKYTVDIDNGCMVIPYTKEWGGQAHPLQNWDYFDKNRKELLNLISWEEFIEL